MEILRSNMKKIIALLVLALCFNGKAQIITTIAGNGTGGFGGDSGPASLYSQLLLPNGMAFDRHGNLYIADRGNNRIRMINTLGIITTVVGNGISGFSGDGGQATVAELSGPMAIAFDALGNMYIADCFNDRIRIVDTFGVINTIAGNGFGANVSPGGAFSGDGGKPPPQNYFSHIA